MASALNHTSEDVSALRLAFIDTFNTISVRFNILLHASPSAAERRNVSTNILELIDTLLGYLTRMEDEFPPGLWQFDQLSDPLDWLRPLQKLPRTSGIASLGIQLRNLSTRMATVSRPVGTDLDSEEDDEDNGEDGAGDIEKVAASGSAVIEPEPAIDKTEAVFEAKKAEAKDAGEGKAVSVAVPAKESDSSSTVVKESKPVPEKAASSSKTPVREASVVLFPKSVSLTALVVILLLLLMTVVRTL